MLLLTLVNRLDGEILLSNGKLIINLKGGHSEAVQVLRFDEQILQCLHTFSLQIAEIYYSQCKKPYELCIEMSQILPKVPEKDRLIASLERQFKMTDDNFLNDHLFINCKITRNLLPVIEQILENPEWNIGVSRIRDNAQVICSAEHVRKMQTDGKTATTIRTHEYWLSPCLEELRRKYQQEGGGEFMHEIITSNYVVKYDPNAPWVKMNTLYRLVDDGFGEVYRVGRTLDVVDIATPAIIN